MNERPLLNWSRPTMVALLMVFLLPPAIAQSTGQLRDYEPVVIEGARMPAWNNTKDITKLGVFSYSVSSGTFTAIPFQIDKKRRINLKFNVNDPSSPPGAANVCEYGYFRELGVTAGSPDDAFASNLLKPTDELAFMWKDAGDRAMRATWLAGSEINVERYEISLTDPNSSSTRWIYVFLWDSGSPALSATKYVNWTSDPNSETCTNGLDSCGTAKGIKTALPTSIPAHSIHFLKNWVADTYKINVDGSFLPTLIARVEYKVGGESEDSWSTQRYPRFLGVTAGDRPVRIIRGVQGAESGAHTTRYDFIYPSYYVRRVNLRVHPLSELWQRVRQDASILNDTKNAVLWTKTGFEKTPTKEYRDIIEGQGPNQDEMDDSKAKFSDWSDIATFGHGSYSHFYRELRNLVAAGENYIYQDKAATQKLGFFGPYVTNTGNTQDGSFPSDYLPCPGCTINDGGCGSDPEDPALNFARLDQILLPLAPRDFPDRSDLVSTDDSYPNLFSPVTFSCRKQNRDYDDLPPVTPCTPIVGLSGSANNGYADLQIDASGCSAGTGFRVYRAIGTGSSTLLRDLRTVTTLRDLMVQPGITYTYRVRGYNDVNTESADSAALTVSVTDTTPPAVPFSVATEPASGKITVTWLGGMDRDIFGFNVWMSTNGGDFTLLNGSPILASTSARWLQIGLQSAATYCFKIAAVDVAGNQSVQTAAVCASPLP